MAVHENYGKYAKMFLGIAGGAVWAIAFQIKVTSIISLFAVIIILFLRNKFKNNIRLMLAFGIAFVLVLTAGEMRVRALPCEENVERDSDPVLYWVALGLHGDGSYAANQDFAVQCELAENKAEREKLVEQKLTEEWRQFFDGEHIVAKIRCNFASGDVGASGYMTYPYKSNNIVHELISWDGAYFWKYACLSTSYLFAIFLLMAIGAFSGASGKKMDFTVMSGYVTTFGIMLFLMLREAQNKQLFNQTGWILLAAAYGLQAIRLPDKFINKKQEER